MNYLKHKLAFILVIFAKWLIQLSIKIDPQYSYIFFRGVIIGVMQYLTPVEKVKN